MCESNFIILLCSTLLQSADRFPLPRKPNFEILEFYIFSLEKMKTDNRLGKRNVDNVCKCTEIFYLNVNLRLHTSLQWFDSLHVQIGEMIYIIMLFFQNHRYLLDLTHLVSTKIYSRAIVVRFSATVWNFH